jgi:hypothetical protein
MKINIMILKKILSSFIVEKKIRYSRFNIDFFRTLNVFRFKNKNDKSLLLIFKQKRKNKISNTKRYYIRVLKNKVLNTRYCYI